MFHHFTVDVEEYFHAHALMPYVQRSGWNVVPGRVHVGVHTLLDLLDAHGTRGTFFMLGVLCRKAPALAREIADRGHEVASHGSDHESVMAMTPSAFRRCCGDAKRILEDAIGRPVIGYRAPSFSITRGSEWALEILLEEGYLYDSSLFPIRRRGYGYAGGQRDPHQLHLNAGILHEVPPATLSLGGLIIPAGGGAYFRHLPYSLVSQALRAAQARGAPGTFYVHPWEVDDEQPRVPTPYLTRLRHYGGIARTLPRLRRLLTDFRFQPIAATLQLHQVDSSARQEPLSTTTGE